ncbi:MAG: hypothetical protein AAB870_04555 [Patescibacteria group bacterium]
MIMHNKTNLYRRIAGTFFLFSILIALAVFYFSFSWATVILKPHSESFTSSQVFALTDKDTYGPDEIKASIQTEILDADGQFDTTGVKEEVGSASASITIVNTTGTAQPLRATTRLLSPNGVLFRTQEFVNALPHSKVSVAIYADKEGDIGAVSDGRFTIPGLWEGLQAQIYGEGFVQKEAGVQKIKIVQQADIDQAKKTLIARLETKFREKISRLAGANTTQYQAFDSSVISFTTSAKEGKEADHITVTIKARFVAVSFDRQAVYERFVEGIKAKLSASQELVAPEPGQLEYNVSINGPSLSQMQLKVSSQAKKTTTQDPRLFDAKALTNKSKAEIIAYFANFDDIGSVDVRLYPFWVINAPALSDHINILLDTK